MLWSAGGGKPTLFALASDPIGGDLFDIRWTDENGNALGTGVNIESKPISLGAQTITASAFSRKIWVASAVTHINVVAKEAEAVITSPSSDQTYAADEMNNLRGSAFDRQDEDMDDSHLTWSVDGVTIGTGRFISQKINKTGLVGEKLTTKTAQE